MTRRTQSWAGILVVFAALGLSGCGYQSEADRERQRDESNTAAGKTGKAAYKVSKEVGKAAREAGREIRKAAGQAREGWKEAAQEDRAKRDR
jgi:hypothetical protein